MMVISTMRVSNRTLPGNHKIIRLAVRATNKQIKSVTASPWSDVARNIISLVSLISHSRDPHDSSEEVTL